MQLCVLHTVSMYVLQVSYMRVFGIVREELETRFGSIGAVAQGTIHFNFEMAAINAARQVIPEATIRACLFHFTQALQRKLDADGNIVHFGAFLYFAIILHLQD